MPHVHPNAGLRLPQWTLDTINELLFPTENRTDFIKEAISREIYRREQLKEKAKSIIANTII